ncbi:hypothetical protein D3C79_816940 [compost metagenome]
MDAEEEGVDLRYIDGVADRVEPKQGITLLQHQEAAQQHDAHQAVEQGVSQPGGGMVRLGLIFGQGGAPVPPAPAQQEERGDQGRHRHVQHRQKLKQPGVAVDHQVHQVARQGGVEDDGGHQPVQQAAQGVIVVFRHGIFPTGAQGAARHREPG